MLHEGRAVTERDDRGNDPERITSVRRPAEALFTVQTPLYSAIRSRSLDAGGSAGT
jgi:hypothetical protein